MDLLLVKILCLVVVFVAMFMAALIPLRLVLWRGNSKHQTRFLSYCNCLAGGVFLGTCFIGLFPTVKAKFAEVLQINRDADDVPIAELTIMIGYFLMLFMEQIALAFSRDHTHDHDSELVEMRSATDADRPDEDRSDGGRSADDQEETEPYRHETHRPSSLQQGDQNHGHSHDFIAQAGSSLRRYMLLLALSIHSIFEGSALGLQETFSKTIHLLVAILLHEVLVAFAFGASLAKLNLRGRSFLQMVIVFSLMIPIGGAVGIAMGHFHGFVAELASAITQGLAAGTFIYVVFVEILPNELVGGQENVWRILFVFTGFMLFAGLHLITILT